MGLQRTKDWAPLYLNVPAMAQNVADGDKCVVVFLGFWIFQGASRYGAGSGRC